MGRPTASDTNRRAGLALVRALTRLTADALDIVARCGGCGLYSAVGELLPQIVRAGARDGISEVELNKTLQVDHSHKSNMRFNLMI
jgi:hypothetical protein